MKSPVALALCILAGSSALLAEQNWPHFAGPDGSGHSTEKSLPVKWDASAVVWKTKLKGTGQSSVVNWGDRLFLTSAAPDGKMRFVHCLDHQTGKLPGKTLDIVARNTIGSASDEIFRAGLIPIQGRLFTRSQDTVYCIGGGANAGK